MNTQTKRTSKYITIALLLFLGVFSYTRFYKLAFAQTTTTKQVTDTIAEVTDTAKEVETDVDETLEKTAESAIQEIKKRIEENTGKVKGALDKMLNSRFAMVGEVQRLNENALTIQNTQGITILAIDEAYPNITKDDAAIELGDIAVGNWVTVLGYKEGESFTPRIISVSEDTLRPPPQIVVLGTVTEISSKAVTIIDRATSEERSFVISTSSDIEDQAGEPAKTANILEDMTVLISATANEDTTEIVTLRSLVPLDESN